MWSLPTISAGENVPVRNDRVQVGNRTPNVVGLFERGGTAHVHGGSQSSAVVTITEAHTDHCD